MQFWVLQYNYDYITVSVLWIRFVRQIGRSLGVEDKISLTVLINNPKWHIL